MLNARLNPEAKKPPNGATSEAKMAMTTQCSWKGFHGIKEKVRCVCGASEVSAAFGGAG